LLPCRVVKDTSAWNNKKELLEGESEAAAQLEAQLAELDEAGMRARVQSASQERDEAQAACTRQAPPFCCCRSRACVCAPLRFITCVVCVWKYRDRG
jgi:hypothetical protein